MQPQVLADVLVLETRAAQQRGRVDRAAGGDDGPRPHRDAVTRRRARLHPAARAALDDHPLGAGVDEDARAGGVRVREPGLHRGLLRAEPAAVAAVAAVLALVAAAHVARHRSRRASRARVRPRCSTCSRADGRVVLLVHAEALADRVEARAVLVGREGGHAVRGPLLAHVVGSAERGRVVDRRAAAEAAARPAGRRSGRAWRRRRRTCTCARSPPARRRRSPRRRSSRRPRARPRRGRPPRARRPPCRRPRRSRPRRRRSRASVSRVDVERPAAPSAARPGSCPSGPA